MAANALSFLQIINRVLVRLRESTVAANNSTDYSTMIGALVNSVKTDIEKAYYWNALRDTYAVSAVPNTTSYALASSGMNAVIIDGWNTTTSRRLTRGTNAEFDEYFYGASSVQTGDVEKYIPAGLDSNYDLQIDIWPSPASTNALKLTIFRPQADLSADADVPLVPQDVLIEEVIARALVEKGEEGIAPPQPGQTFIRTDLLADAVSREAGHDGTEMDWEPE